MRRLDALEALLSGSSIVSASNATLLRVLCMASTGASRFDLWMLLIVSPSRIRSAKDPPFSVTADSTSYCSSHDCFSFEVRPVLGLPFEALPPSAAIRLLSAFGSFLLRASPNFRANSDRSFGVVPFQRAKAPSLPSACACGFGSFLDMPDTLT